MPYNNSPRVSIIIPTHNRANLLSDAINSILQQSMQDFEILIIDDYSTDETQNVVNSFKDKRIRYVRKSKELKGIASSRNMGYTLSRGIFIVNQDDDDISEPIRLEKLLEVIEAMPVRSVVGSWVWHEFQGQRKIRKYPIQHDNIIKKIKRPFNRVGIIAGTIIARAELLREFGCRLKFEAMEDWDMILRMVESESVYFQNIAQPLYCYRQSEKGLSFSDQRIKINLFLRACEKQRAIGKSELETFADYIAELNRLTFWSLQQNFFIFLKKLQLLLGWIN